MDKCRAVLDSNVILAARQSTHTESPNREIIDRWRRGEYDFLYSADTLAEYAEKLSALDLTRADAVAFLALVVALGQAVEIRFFHLPRYPHDSDDIAFLLCAWNGLASHLVSYDGDLLALADAYHSSFTICRPLEFLAAVRSSQG